MPYQDLNYHQLFNELRKMLWYAHRYHLTNDGQSEQFYQDLCFKISEEMIKKEKKQFKTEVFPFLPKFMTVHLVELLF